MLKQLRGCSAAQKWEVHLDPGHAKKNLVKALMTVFGEKKEFEGLAMRIPTFVMRCTKRAEKEHTNNVAGTRAQFLQWLDCVVPHYTRCCGNDCPHHQQDDIEPQDISSASISTTTSTSDYSKVYLHTHTHGTQITMLESIIHRMKQSARYFIHGHNTCNAERYHRERLKFTPKQIEFWNTWAPRCALNQLIHNQGYAQTHRLVLAKLRLLLPSSDWATSLRPGNQYVAAMDSERRWHSTRKSQSQYNRRQDQLSREFGKRRAVHDRASQGRGHDYQHSPPLYNGDDDGEVSSQPQKKSRRSKEQIQKEAEEKKVEEDRLRALFDSGDSTFTTLGVIDVNVLTKRKGRKTKRKEGEGEKEGRERDELGGEGKEQGEGMEEAGEENSQPPVARKKRALPVSEQRTPVVATVWKNVAAGSAQTVMATAARAINFR